jgi:hypothetical protein
MQCSLIHIWQYRYHTQNQTYCYVYGYRITSDNTGICKGTVTYCAGLKLLVNHVGALVLCAQEKMLCRFDNENSCMVICKQEFVI